MKKLSQVVSAALVATFALANVVSADINTAGNANESDLTQMLTRIEHKTVNTNPYYESAIDPKVETASIAELTQAYSKFEADLNIVTQYSLALCKAKKELIEIDKKIKRAPFLTLLSDNIYRIDPQSRLAFIWLNVDPLDTDFDKLDTQKMNFLTKEDFEELHSLGIVFDEWQFAPEDRVLVIKNKDLFGNKKVDGKDEKALKAFKEEIKAKYGEFGITYVNDANGDLDYVAIGKGAMVDYYLGKIRTVMEPNNPKHKEILAYQSAVKELKAYSGDEIKGANITFYENTLAELRRKASKASAKVKLIEELGKRLHITFLPCEFEDPFKTAEADKETKQAEVTSKESMRNAGTLDFLAQLP